MITSFTAAKIQLRKRKQVPEENAPLVGSLLLDGAQPPAAGDVFALEGANGYIRIANVQRKQHLNGSHTTRKDDGLRSIIFAHPQKSRRIEPAGDAFEAGFYPHSPSGHIAGGVCELLQDLIGAKSCVTINGFNQRDEKVFARDPYAFEKKRGGRGFEIVRETRSG